MKNICLLLVLLFNGCNIKVQLVDTVTLKHYDGDFREGTFIPGSHATSFTIEEEVYKGECSLFGMNFIGYNGQCKLELKEKDNLQCDVKYNSFTRNLHGQCKNSYLDKEYDLITP